MASPLVKIKEEYGNKEVVFAQGHSEENYELYPYYPATVESCKRDTVTCKWFDPDDIFLKDPDLKVIQEIPRTRIMSFNIANKEYIESIQMAKQEERTRNYWKKCVAAAVGSITGCSDDDNSKRAKFTRFQFIKQLEEQLSESDLDDDVFKSKVK